MQDLCRFVASTDEQESEKNQSECVETPTSLVSGVHDEQCIAESQMHITPDIDCFRLR